MFHVWVDGGWVGCLWWGIDTRRGRVCVCVQQSSVGASCVREVWTGLVPAVYFTSNIAAADESHPLKGVFPFRRFRFSFTTRKPRVACYEYVHMRNTSLPVGSERLVPASRSPDAMDKDVLVFFFGSRHWRCHLLSCCRVRPLASRWLAW